jgi:tRNA(His) guanylyltransferase
MANSKYEYVKDFETSTTLLPHTYTIVRIDGVSFSQFAITHHWKKPMDERAVALMNACAIECMKRFPDIIMAYGVSDEFSFLFNPFTTLYSRRLDKIISVLVSTFASQFVFLWPHYFDIHDEPLQSPPSFDARATSYPTLESARDYFSWRQVDCHINALYNLAFTNLVEKEKLSNHEAHLVLGPTDSAQKNEILFSRFGINYNNSSEVYRKGNILIWSVDNMKPTENTESEQKSIENNDTMSDNASIEPTGMQDSNSPSISRKRSPPKPKRSVHVIHEDMINPSFYDRHIGILPYIPSRDLLQAAKIAKKQEKRQKYNEMKQSTLATITTTTATTTTTI